MGKKTKETVEFAIKDIPIDTADKIVSDIKDFEEDEICKVAGVFRQYGIEPKTIDRRCVPMLKELPGDEWFAMDKSAEFIRSHEERKRKHMKAQIKSSEYIVKRFIFYHPY